jgi:alkylation response protein AidB-like acyl-CoA dehydrogenase
VDVALSEEQLTLKETTRRFLERHAPVAALRESQSSSRSFSPEYWATASQLGWTSILVPEQLGGVGGETPLVDLAVIAEEVGHAVAPGPLLPCSVVVDALVQSGSSEQIDTFLPRLIDGSHTAAWAYAEHADYWNVRDFATIATSKGTGWILNGTKTSVEGADVADVLLVTAITDDGPAQFLVPRHTDGVQVSEVPCLDVSRHFADINFNNVHLDADLHLRADPQSEAQIERQRVLATTLIVADLTGLVDAMFSTTIEYLRDRYAFGRPLASFQALKHRIADHKLALERMFSVSSALARANCFQSEETIQLASVAKAYVGDAAMEVLSDCGQLFGGIAMTWEHDYHFYLRRATVNRVLYGSPVQHREHLCQLLGVGTGE